MRPRTRGIEYSCINLPHVSRNRFCTHSGTSIYNFSLHVKTPTLHIFKNTDTCTCTCTYIWTYYTVHTAVRINTYTHSGLHYRLTIDQDRHTCIQHLQACLLSVAERRCTGKSDKFYLIPTHMCTRLRYIHVQCTSMYSLTSAHIQ